MVALPSVFMSVLKIQVQKYKLEHHQWVSLSPGQSKSPQYLFALRQ